MKGIRILTDERGRKFAEIDLQLHRQLWEDFHDALVVRDRAGEKREPWEAVKKRLVRAGKLDG